jgi:hypothetical protein
MLLVVVAALSLVWGSWGGSHSNGSVTVSCRFNLPGCNTVLYLLAHLPPPPPFADPSFWEKMW